MSERASDDVAVGDHVDDLLDRPDGEHVGVHREEYFRIARCGVEDVVGLRPVSFA